MGACIVTLCGNMHEDLIDNDVGEPTSGVDEVLDFETTPMDIIGAPDGWIPPSCPLTFVGYIPKEGVPSEDELDNPTGWSIFKFTPSYQPKTKNLNVT